MFVVHCVDKPGHEPVRLANREAHLAYARAAGAVVVAAGPTLTEDRGHMTGSILILDLPDCAAVEDFLAQDPYAKAGLFESVTILPWRRVLGG